MSIRNKILIPGLVLAGGIYGIYNLKNFSNEEQENKKNIIPITSSYKTTQGKFERTYRWDKILDEREKKHKIEKGLLKALGMREGEGDPLKLNESGDGGAGMWMFQPGTAKYCGLDIYGNSNKMGVDKSHGKKLKELVKENKYNYEKLAKLDERFDVYKSSDAAAKFLKKLYNQHGSWDKALSAYNRGQPAKNPEKTNHVKFIRKYQAYYNSRDN
ncbi:MAG: transglycosylase SLT domain-containing protein [Nanoarchaeota archaeon]|nr:transglycosylase SLT domain-containing protein [Nanoarchaeota archaeon]